MSVVSGSKEITRFFGKSAVIATASDRDGPKKKIRGPSAPLGMTQESQHDPPAPSPTGCQAAGRRVPAAPPVKITGEVRFGSAPEARPCACDNSRNEAGEGIKTEDSEKSRDSSLRSRMTRGSRASGRASWTSGQT